MLKRADNVKEAKILLLLNETPEKPRCAGKSACAFALGFSGFNSGVNTLEPELC